MANQLSQYSEKERLGSKGSLVCWMLRLLNTNDVPLLFLSANFTTIVPQAGHSEQLLL